MDQPVASNQPGSDTSNPVTTATPLATTGATNINLYTQPEAKKDIILNAIAGAQHSVDLAVYFLTDKDVIASLIDAAKRVTVRVMLDVHGYIGQKATIQQVHD
ncbi:MAG: FAM83 family protein, partial [Ktedonobacteraceae bacterium]